MRRRGEVHPLPSPLDCNHSMFGHRQASLAVGVGAAFLGRRDPHNPFAMLKGPELPRMN